MMPRQPQPPPCETDSWLCPLANTADRVLTVDVDGPSPYDSVAYLVALIEALVASLVERLGESGRHRVFALERLRNSRTWDDREIAV